VVDSTLITVILRDQSDAAFRKRNITHRVE
jgi:hypothetical protein